VADCEKPFITGHPPASIAIAEVASNMMPCEHPDIIMRAPYAALPIDSSEY